MIIFPLIVRAIRSLVCDHNQPAPPPPPPLPSEAEIDAKLAAIANERGFINLNWRESIVDLLRLLDMRNDFHTRALLYADLDGAVEYEGSVAQNTWMIQQVRRRFAEGRLD